jgi:predicted RNase H-like nuclease
MMAFCVLVKGPCRGKSCDFWARIKIRRFSVEELVRQVYDDIIECETGTAFHLKIALQQFWLQLGIRDMDRLCYEDPELYNKIWEVEHQIIS